MSDSSESGLDVFDDLVRKPRSSSKASSDGNPAEPAPSDSPTGEPPSAPSAPEDTPPVLDAADEDDTASTPTSVTQPSQPLEPPSADKSQDEQSTRAIPPPAVSASRAPRPPAPSDSGIVPAALLSSSRPARPPAPSESRPPKPKAPPPPPTPKASRPPLPSSPAVARVPPPASTPGISVPVHAVAGATSGKGARWLLIAAGLFTLGLLAAVLTFALTPKAGTLVVSASGPRGLALPQVATYVDGVKRCDTSPCRVDGLSDGVHIVEARAPGHISIAGKAVKIEAGEEVPFDLELPAQEPADEEQATEREVELEKPPPAEKDRPAAEPPPKTKLAELQPAVPPPTVQTKPAAASLGQKLAGVSEPAPAAAAATTSEPQATQGTLNINSIPASNVVVDGRPLGRTPRLGVSVTPGAHTVIFIHPEHGRKVSQVSVQAGQTATATARFP